jgi:hypothetical protein
MATTTWLTIPTQGGVPYYTITIKLDGREFGLRFAWNQREERWYMDIRDDTGEALAVGVKVIANWPLLRGSQFDTRLPPGVFMAFDLTQDGSPPGFYDLEPGRRVELSYLPVSEA